MQSALEPRFGTHVTGPRYWDGAIPPVDDIVIRLARRESVKCFGLRRIGKSSLLAEAARRLTARQHLVIRVDGQQITSIPALLQTIMRALPADGAIGRKVLDRIAATAQLPPTLKAMIQNFVLRRVTGADDAQFDTYAELLFEETGKAIAAIPPGQRPMLWFDELPFFCLNVLQAGAADSQPRIAARLNRLLAILRDWRGEEIGVAMALGGSVSMHWLRRRYGIQAGHLNDCLDIQVRELDEANAEAMVRAMIAHVGPRDWSGDIGPRLIALLPARYPGVIQYAFSRIRDVAALDGPGLEIFYRQDIAGGLEQDYYHQFDRRIEYYTLPERIVIADLLDAILAAPDAILPWSRAIAICPSRELIEHLADDSFILAGRTNGVRFGSGLVRVWHLGRER